MHIYTDGACSGNPGPGGWAFVVLRDDDDAALPTVEHSGSEARTTNQCMELLGAIRALEYAKAQPPEARPSLRVTTDSQYVRRGITEWIHVWVRKQWRTAKGGFVQNQDLWRQLHALNCELRSVQWDWVKARSGCAGNERADALAKAAITRLRVAALEKK